MEAIFHIIAETIGWVVASILGEKQEVKDIQTRDRAARKPSR